MLNLAPSRRSHRLASRPALDALESRQLLTRGLPDPVFNGGSAVIAALDPSGTTGVKLVQTIPLADGETLFVGQFYPVNGVTTVHRYVVVKLAADGTFDPAFGSGGRAFTPANEVPLDFEVNGAAVQGDGKILLVGSAAGPVAAPPPDGSDPGTSPRMAAVARLDADGSIDPSYGTAGFRFFAFQTPDPITASSVLTQARVDPEGRLVVEGTEGDTYTDAVTSRVAFARLTPSGDLDATFGSAGTGITVLRIVPEDTSPYLIERYTPGPLFVSDQGVAGAGTLFTQLVPQRGETSIDVFRLDASGKPPASFGDGGSEAVNLLPADRFPADYSTLPTDVAIDPENRTVVVGYYSQLFGAVTGTAVERLATDGSLDTAFGDADTPGVARRASTGPAFSNVSVAADSSLLLAGIPRLSSEASDTSGTLQLDLSRLDPSGKPDATFAPGGTVTTAGVGAFPVASAEPLVPIFDAQGRVILSATTSTIGGLFAAQRFLSADTTPPTPTPPMPTPPTPTPPMPTPTPPPAAISPTIAQFIPTASRGALGTIRVTYSEPLYAGSVGSPSSYRLVSAGADRRFGTRDDRTIKLRVPSYNAATRTVTLRARNRVGTNQPLELIARGTLIDGAGNRLAGAGGVPGSDFVRFLGAKAR